MGDLIIGRDRLGGVNDATRLEWLVTNGIGGYASGTAGGALARREHGLLVAALGPPDGRVLLLAKLSERIEIDRAWTDLDTNRWRGGAVSPEGHRHLESFRLEGGVPVWTWAVGDTRLEKRVWMEHGENTTLIQYRLAAARATVTLELGALVDHRDAGSLTARGEAAARVEPVSSGVRVELGEGGPPLWLFAPGAAIVPAHDWYRGYALARESERGRDDAEDHLLAAWIRARLSPGDGFIVVASTRSDAGRLGPGPLGLGAALARRHAHDRSLIEMWEAAQPRLARAAPAWVRRMVLAADAFVTDRAPAGLPGGKNLIAGYPWPADAGRETLAALPGLTLSTGRPEVARAVLAAWAQLVDQGMLPAVPAAPGAVAGHDAADAALWFFQAVRATFEATRDVGFLDSMYPALEEIGAWTERGTRFGIRVDPRDGLLRVGGGDAALTWMDARLDGRPVTPRKGKPVEINALWYNALTAMAGFAHHLKRPAEPYEQFARRVEHAFERYWNAEAGCLYDVIDGPDGPDGSVRPNQLLALSLPDSPLPPARRRAVLESCGRWLVTSHGLRSLSPADPRYRGRCAGDARAQEAAIHQGTAWVWLLPHYALAHHRVHGDREAALALLEPLGSLTGAYGAGFLPAMADGDPPHAPRGVIAQAWALGETLRAWHALAARREVRRAAVTRRTKTAVGAAQAV